MHSIVLSILYYLLSTTQAFSTKAEKMLHVEWSEFIPKDDLQLSKFLPKRSGHVAWTTADKSVHVFGGYAEEQPSSRYVVNDLWKWKDGWSKLEPTGDIPGPRLVSAGALLGKTYYLFGGWDSQQPGTGGLILDDVHKFQEGTWTKLAVTLPNGPASRHVVVALEGPMLALFHNHRCSNHVFVFNAESESFQKVATTGEAPTARGLHAACAMGKYVVMFGGAAQSGTMSNEVFLLDSDCWYWTPLNVSGGPSPRAGPCLCQYSENCVLLFGGAEASEVGLNPRGDVWALHIDALNGKGRWDLLCDDMNEHNGPPPRNAASLCMIDHDETSKSYLLTGGWAPFRETWGDNFVLKVSSI